MRLLPTNDVHRDKVGRIRAAMQAPARPELEETPCTFLADQGIRRRDEFAVDSTHRHPGCGCRDFPPGSEGGSGKAREFAGCWRLRSFDTEAETRLSRGDSSRLVRLSLQSISVVRIGDAVYGGTRQISAASSNPSVTQSLLNTRLILRPDPADHRLLIDRVPDGKSSAIPRRTDIENPQRETSIC